MPEQINTPIQCISLSQKPIREFIICKTYWVSPNLHHVGCAEWLARCVFITYLWHMSALENITCSATVSTKRKYTLSAKPSTQKTRGTRGNGGGVSHPPLSWTNSMVSLVHPLLFIWPLSVFSSRLDKSVYFLLEETVMREVKKKKLKRTSENSSSIKHTECLLTCIM